MQLVTGMADPNPQDAAFDKLCAKVLVICDRVVRGRRATDTWHVKAHNSMRVASIIFSALGGAGLVAVNVNPDLPKQHGAALAGSMISLIFSIVMQLANEFGVGKRAEQARAATYDFAAVDTELEIILSQPDPVDLVNKLLDKSAALLIKHGPVLPVRSTAMESTVTKQCDGLVKLYRVNWVLSSNRKTKKLKDP
jgi:hypothetical protein